MERIGLCEGNKYLQSSEITTVHMSLVKFPKVRVYYFFLQKSLKMYIPVNVQTHVWNLVWFLFSTKFLALVDCICESPAQDSIQSLAGNPHVPDFPW